MSIRNATTPTERGTNTRGKYRDKSIDAQQDNLCSREYDTMKERIDVYEDFLKKNGLLANASTQITDEASKVCLKILSQHSPFGIFWLFLNISRQAY